MGGLLTSVLRFSLIITLHFVVNSFQCVFSLLVLLLLFVCFQAAFIRVLMAVNLRGPQYSPDQEKLVMKMGIFFKNKIPFPPWAIGVSFYDPIFLTCFVPPPPFFFYSRCWRSGLVYISLYLIGSTASQRANGVEEVSPPRSIQFSHVCVSLAVR